MQNNTDLARMDQLVSHVKEEAQLQGKLQLEAGQSDIARIISVCASVAGDDVQLMEDVLEFSGRLIFEVLYVSGDAPDDVHVLQAQSQFHHSIHSQGVQSGMHTRYHVQVQDVEEQLENPRSIALTADVCFDVWVFETAAIDPLQGADTLQTKNETFSGVETLEQQTQVIDVEKQVQLPLRALPVDSVLSQDAFAVVRDVTGTVEGTHADAELVIFMTYYSHPTEDGEVLLQSTNLVVPFGFDLNWEQRGLGENAHMELTVDTLQLTAAADEMGQMRLIDVEAQVSASACLWQETEAELPVDAYLPGHQTEVTARTAQLCCGVQEKFAQRMHHFSVTLPSGYPPMEQVICMRVHPVVRETVSNQDGLLVVGTLRCDIIYRAAQEQQPIYGFHASIPFEERLAIVCNGTDVLVRAWCMQANAGVLDATQVDCRLQLETCASCVQVKPMQVVSHVQDEGLVQEQSAIVMSIVTQNDDLWSIAKRFNVSMEAVLAANPKYESQSPAIGDKVVLYRRIVNG